MSPAFKRNNVRGNVFGQFNMEVKDEIEKSK